MNTFKQGFHPHAKFGKWGMDQCGVCQMNVVKTMVIKLLGKPIVPRCVGLFELKLYNLVWLDMEKRIAALETIKPHSFFAWRRSQVA